MVTVTQKVALVKFCVCPFFPFGTEGGMWDVIVLIPGHCLSIYFESQVSSVFEMLDLPYKHDAKFS